MLGKLLIVLLAGTVAAQDCGSAACTGACRQLCNALTLQKVLTSITTYDSTQNETQLAAQLFSPSSFMSIVPIGSFEGPKTALEYITTFSRKSEVPSIVNLTDFKPRQMVMIGNFFMLQFDLYLTNPFDASYSATLRGTSLLTFDSKSRIKVNLLDYSTWHDTVHKLNWPATVTPERVDRLQDLLCNAHQSYCQGSNKQYDSVAACKAFLADVPALAPVYRLAGNNLYCRLFHARYVSVDPAVHCPHIGPSGGGKCIDDPLSYVPSHTDSYVPIGTFFHAPPSVAPIFKQMLGLTGR